MSGEATSSYHRTIVVVGIPGVGKSTVVKALLEKLEKEGKKARLVNFGSVMFEEAQKLLAVKSRDDIRKLPLEEQRKLQVHAASEIARLQEERVIVDTHLFIATREGLWPGMPVYVLEALKPSNIVLVTATADEILSRRGGDRTRKRDAATKESLETELQAAKSFLFASSLICGCPALIVHNHQDGVEPAVDQIAASVM